MPGTPAPKILIVEDEAIVAMDMESQLREMGYKVCGIVDNAASAIARARERKPDLILMDIVIKGGTDGVETARQIGDELQVPIVFLTAYNDLHTVERVAQTAPYGYLTKPFDVKQLRAVIEIALSRAALEQRLRVSEQWFSSTLRCVADGVVTTDEQGGVRFMNPSAEAMLGWPLDAVIGRDIERVAPLMDARTGLSAASSVKRVLHENAGAEIDTGAMLLTRHGEKLFIDNSIAPIKDSNGKALGAVLIFRDVRNRLAMEEKLKSSEERFRNAFDFAPVGMAFVGLDNRFLQVNEALCTLLGCSQSELLGADQSEFSQAGDLAIERACLERVLSGESASVQFEKNYRTRDGSHVCTLTSASLLRKDDAPMCFLFQIHNVTEREILRDLSAYQEQIKEEERKRIAREIHDELGSLLTGIKAYLSVAINSAERTGTAPDRQLTDASNLADAAIETVRRVITDLRPSVLDQLGLWAALEWYAGEIAKRSGLICTFTIDEPAAETEIHAERSTVLFRIVQEALTNVVRHAEASCVAVRAMRRDGAVIIEVEDNGKGIKAERLPDRESWGIAGMHERVRYCGGDLTLEGVPGKGTLVRLRMPLENPAG